MFNLQAQRVTDFKPTWHAVTHAAKRAPKVRFARDRCSVSAGCYCSLSLRTDTQIDSAMCCTDAPPRPHHIVSHLLFLLAEDQCWLVHVCARQCARKGGREERRVYTVYTASMWSDKDFSVDLGKNATAEVLLHCCSPSVLTCLAFVAPCAV